MRGSALGRLEQGIENDSKQKSFWGVRKAVGVIYNDT